MNEFWQGVKILESINWAAVSATLLRVGLIIVLAAVAAALLRKLIRLLRAQISRGIADPERLKRTETLGRALRYMASVVISLIAGMLILSELGVSIAPILGAAGVVGLAAGFASQSLIKDYFNGFILLLENQIRQGDVVEAGGKSGLVEELTLRYVRLRDYDGHVHFIPNSAITTVSNMSRDFAKSVVDAGIAYREDVDRALAVMARTGADLRKDAVFGPKIIEELEIVGVNEWADSAVILRCRFTVKPLEQWNVRREFLKRLKRAFDAAGIEIPFPHLTVYAGQLTDGSAPAFRVLSAAEKPPPGPASRS